VCLLSLSLFLLYIQVRKLDIATSTASVIGRHTGEPSKVACSCLARMGENIVVSAGWNSQLLLWDIRSSSQCGSVDLPGKAFGLDVDEERNRIVVATSCGRRLVFIDYLGGGDSSNKAAAAASIVLDRESSLKYQTRCVQFFPNGQGIALGSIEGRVAVEFLPELGFDDTTTTAKKYAFKCHRVQDTVYPVNCIAFHPKETCSFATGGCDGTVVTWDGLNKKKLTTLPKFSTSISALAFSPTGQDLAIAASYTFEEGERDHPRDEIFVRRMLDSEIQPKGK
jgi:cell cycle arrest protein BUB3